MAQKATKGTAQLGAEVDAALLREFRAFVRGRGEKFRDHLEMAARRHMDNPPPPLKPAVPPLPPVPPADAPAEPKRRGKK